jgi:hypothetical protein
MDQIAFDITYARTEAYKVVDILINGLNLRHWLAEIEHATAAMEGQPSLAGAYEGLPPLLVLPPRRHFWGLPEAAYRHGDHHTSLLEYAHSGVPGDWRFAARIEVDGHGVTWQDYCQVKRPHWSYQALPVFHFDLVQYQAALAEAARRAY